MSDVLYRWPPAAKLGSRISKEKFYEHGNISTTVREKFVSEVQTIIWSYKLAETTTNLPGSAAVPEIQVFEIVAKHKDVSDHVLTSIDRAIPLPIIFEITRNHGDKNQIRMAATHKQLSTGAPKTGPYFSTKWMPEGTDRHAFPAAINLASLYGAFLGDLASIQVNPDEEVAQLAGRFKQIGLLEREIAAMERKLHAEKQFNRKVELHRALKIKQELLKQQRYPRG